MRPPNVHIAALAAILAAAELAVPAAGDDVTKAPRETTREASAAGAAQKRPAIPPIGIVGFLASPRGRALFRSSTHPMIRAIAERLGEKLDAPASAPATPAVRASSGAAQPEAVAGGCGPAAGTRFNLEPRPAPAVAPQNGTSVDFLPAAGLSGGDLVAGAANDLRGLFGALGDSMTGYFVHRNGASANPCAPDFDGGLPSITSITGELVPGGGDTAVEADPARGAFFIVDTRFGLSVSAIGLFRTTAANLNSPVACPGGTHDATAAGACWPVHTEVNPRTDGTLNVFPHLAVDPRPAGSGTGAGDVYVSNIFSTLGAVFTILSVCNNSLTACSPAVRISGGDLTTQTSNVRVRPDIATNPSGAVTVTYVNVVEGPPPDFLQSYDIKYVTCTPQGAPNPPVCAAPRLIVREDQPVPSRGGGLGDGSLAAANFLVTTHPKHEHRQDANGVETYVVWDRCKVQNIQGGGICPDADLRLAASNNNGMSWNFGNVDTGTGDQYFPAIRTDSSNTVNIAYMSAQADSMKHRARVILRQVAPGASTPDPPGAAQVITTTAMDPAADFFFGDSYIGSYIGVAARSTPSGNHAYVHHTHTLVNGIFNGVPAPEQSNHLSRFDY